MHSTKMFVICCVIRHILATDIAREVEGGVQLLKTGSIQLIVPDILSFTIKKDASCQGDLEICYVYDPSVRAKIRTYINVGTMCPPDSCTLLMTHSGSAFGLGSEQHNGNFYGILVEGSSVSCPRYIVDGRSNFTILELPTCPVIVEGAMLPKNEKTKPKTANSIVWIIPVCVGLFLLVIAIAIIGFYFCTRSRKQPVVPPTHRRKFSGSNRSQQNIVISASPKTPTSKNTAFQEDSAKSNNNF